jgi:hypothetical protein
MNGFQGHNNKTLEREREREREREIERERVVIKCKRI